MSMFSDLMDKVFGRSKDSAEEAKEAADEAQKAAEKAQKVADEAREAAAEAAEEAAEAAGDAAEAAAESAGEAAEEATSLVDVESMLNDLAENADEKLDWKVSIVDLLKLVDLDSSYGARKEMAVELGYSEEDIESKGSAEMNMWLHKQVMKKIAANGGKVPEDLTS